MKVIDVGHHDPTLDEVIGFAKEELVVLRYPDGPVFALSQVDDFDVEVELPLKNGPSRSAACSRARHRPREALHQS
jgi:hypothetical protein